MKILIVDDVPANLRVLRAMLESDEIQIVEARDGLEAIELIEREPVTVVISDIMMPRMDGYRLCYQLRQDPRFEALAFIFYTSTYTSRGDEQFSLQIGADRFVKKPISAGALLAVVHEVVASPRHERLIAMDAARELELLREYNRRLFSKLEQKSEAVSASQQQLSALVNNVDGILWEADPQTLQRTFISQQAERLLGYPGERLLNDAGFWAAIIHPDDRAKVIAAMHEAVRTMRPGVREYRIQTSAGRTVWVRDSMAVLRDRGEVTKLCGMLLDVTEQKNAVDALRESEERYRLLVEHAPEAIIVHQAEIVVFANPAALKLMRVTHAEEMVGHPLAEFVHPESSASARQRLREQSVGDPLPGDDLQLRRSDGTAAMIEATSIPFLYQGKRSVQVVMRDITERRQLESQLRQAQKMEAIGQLAGGVAHDFNNLLTVIQINASFLGSDARLSERSASCASDIAAAAERAALLTRQLLTFSRKQVAQMCALEVNQLVGNLTNMLRRILGEDVELAVKLATGELTIQADPGMIEQVLMNLSVNARDAMPRGGQLTIETQPVRLLAEDVRSNSEARPGDFIVLRVADTGEGIAPDVLPHVFEPFFTTKEIGKGTGLGLATVYGIIKQHQGWIEIETVVGRGTVVCVLLPALSRPAVTAPVFVRQAPPRGTETVLVVEDERPLRKVLRTALENLGYRVLEAASGADALPIWKAHRGEIHLLVTDLVMPAGLNGRDLADVLRVDVPGLPVVYTSGYSPDVVSSGLSLREGVNFVPKPYRPEQFARTVRAALDAAKVSRL